MTKETRAVKSSNLSSVTYDGGKEEMEVTFHNGSVYRYEGVPKRVFKGLCDAKSCGGYFHRHVRDAFPNKRVG